MRPIRRLIESLSVLVEGDAEIRQLERAFRVKADRASAQALVQASVRAGQFPDLLMDNTIFAALRDSKFRVKAVVGEVGRALIEFHAGNGHIGYTVFGKPGYVTGTQDFYSINDANEYAQRLDRFLAASDRIDKR